MPNNRRYYHKKPKKVDNYCPPFGENILSQNIDVLKIRDDTKKLLQGAKINTLKDVLKREAKDFYKISTFNKKNLNDLLKAVKMRKLYLKPTLPPVEKTDSNNNTAKNNNKNKKDFSNQNTNKNDNNDFPKNKRPKLPNKNNKNRKNVREKPYTMVTLIKRPPKVVVRSTQEPHDIYVKINKNGKWGFKQRIGKQMAVPAIYDEVFNYKDDLCCVQKDDKFGFINRQGEEIIPIEYDCATSFSEGYACVFKHDKCGYIDIENNVVIDFNYEAGTSVINGECRVKKDGKWGELHINMPKEGTISVNDFELGENNIRWII